MKTPILLSTLFLTATIHAQECIKPTVAETQTVGCLTADGLAMAWLGHYPTGKVGFVNAQGQWLIPAQYKFAKNFIDGLAEVQSHDNNKFTYINTQGTPISEFKYNFVWAFSRMGLARVEHQQKLGFINRQGKEVIPPLYDGAAGYFDEAVEAVLSKGKWGLIDRQHRIIMPFQYERLKVQEGMVLVCQKKCGFADFNGKMIIPMQYDHAFPFLFGAAAVTQGKQHFYINQQGNKLTKQQSLTLEAQLMHRQQHLLNSIMNMPEQLLGK